MAQPSPYQSTHEPTITNKIQTVAAHIVQLQADNSNPPLLAALIEYKRFLEEQIKVYSDVSCRPKTHAETGCIPPRR